MLHIVCQGSCTVIVTATYCICTKLVSLPWIWQRSVSFMGMCKSSSPRWDWPLSYLQHAFMCWVASVLDRLKSNRYKRHKSCMLSVSCFMIPTSNMLTPTSHDFAQGWVPSCSKSRSRSSSSKWRRTLVCFKHGVSALKHLLRSRDF